MWPGDPLAQVKGVIDGLCKFHHFEFRVPVPTQGEIAGLDEWEEAKMSWAQVQEQFPQFFAPQLIPGNTGACVTKVVENGDPSTMCKTAAGVNNKVLFRHALGVTLPWLFLMFGMQATAHELMMLWYQFPIIQHPRSRQTNPRGGRGPAAGGHKKAAGSQGPAAGGQRARRRWRNYNASGWHNDCQWQGQDWDWQDSDGSWQGWWDQGWEDGGGQGWSEGWRPRQKHKWRKKRYADGESHAAAGASSGAAAGASAGEPRGPPE